jgi:hypothetical protein
MRSPQDRVTVPASLLAVLCGVVLGLAAFATAATLWRAGQFRIAGLFADSIVLGALVLVAGITLLAQPTKLRRARVPIGRPLPPAWWPAPAETIPVLAVYVGAPLVVGAGAAVLIFR